MSKYFRDPRIAASLKQFPDRLLHLPQLPFPRSPDRGIIEATATSGSCLLAPDFRDPRIAASLKRDAPPDRAGRAAAFPRSPDRGIIEAGRGSSG